MNGEVRLRCYKGHVYVLGRSSSTEKLYSEQEASMDSLEDFEPTDTTGFVAIQTIRYVSLLFSFVSLVQFSASRSVKLTCSIHV